MILVSFHLSARGFYDLPGTDADWEWEEIMPCIPRVGDEVWPDALSGDGVIYYDIQSVVESVAWYQHDESPTVIYIELVPPPVRKGWLGRLMARINPA